MDHENTNRVHSKSLFNESVNEMKGLGLFLALRFQEKKQTKSIKNRSAGAGDGCSETLRGQAGKGFGVDNVEGGH